MAYLSTKVYVDPSDIVGSINNLINALFSVATITANPGGGQTNATALPSSINRVATVTTAGDSVKLPASTPGSFLTVINDGANSMNVFPQTGDKINQQTANAAFAMAAGKSADCYCAVAGTWHIVMSQ